MRYIITHGHIFKNAGTTFDSALEKAFGKDFCDHRDDKAMRQGGAEYLKQFILDNPNLKAISSHHLCNPLPQSDEFKCIPVYFLRNPIERIVSVYNFERKQKSTVSLGAKMASKLSLIEYVKWRMEPDVPKVIFDYQTHYIGALGQKKLKGVVDLKSFRNALDRLLSGEALFGVVEQFDESFEHIAEKLQTYFPETVFEFKKKNVSNSDGNNVKFQRAIKDLTKVLPEVIERNMYDLALFRAAKSVIDDKKERL
jgi:hypothetical protein